jgi:hypothetical protein
VVLSNPPSLDPWRQGFRVLGFGECEFSSYFAKWQCEVFSMFGYKFSILIGHHSIFLLKTK